MNFVDKLSWSIRHARKRLFESLLIVFAIGLGIAVIVAILSVVFNAQSQLAGVGRNDVYFREFRIYSSAHFSSFSGQEPILSVIEERPDIPLQVSLAELDDLQKSLPEGMYVFVEENYSNPSPLLPFEEDPEADTPGKHSYRSFTTSVRSVDSFSVEMEGTVDSTEPEVGDSDSDHVELDEDIFDNQTIEMEPESLQTFETSLRSSTVGIESEYGPSMYDLYETILLTAVTLPYQHFNELEVALGNWFETIDIESGNKVIVLTDELAQRLFPEENPIGKMVPVSNYDEQTIHYEVIGVLAPMSEEDQKDLFYRGDFNVGYIPITAAPRYGGFDESEISDRTFDFFIIGVSKDMDIAKSTEIIQAEIKLRYGELATVQNFYLSSDSVDGQIQSIYIIIGIFASLGLVIAVINILNLMLARVLRRTKSVGLSIALGAHKGSVFGQFLLEALSLGVFGAGLGIGLSYGLLQILNSVLGMPTEMGLTFGYKEILSGCGLGLLVSLIFGIYPAYQGAQINPIDALRAD